MIFLGEYSSLLDRLVAVAEPTILAVQIMSLSMIADWHNSLP